MANFTVFGAGGFIGGHLVDYLRRNRHVVWPLKRHDLIPEHDLGHVIYCIGFTNDFAANPMDTVEAHACSLISVLRRARFERLVYLSSARLYDGLSGPVDEKTELRLSPSLPRHLYDLSKALGEALIHHGPAGGVVARLASVYDNELRRNDFLCNTVQRALMGGDLEIDSRTEIGRDYIHVDDVVRALEAMALGAREAIYNVASGVMFTNGELATLLDRELGCRLHFRGVAPPHLPPAIDVGRLARDFNLHAETPAIRLRKILRSLIKREDKGSRP
jgi:nucleoside-diphosphate-sugar epimerase